MPSLNCLLCFLVILLCAPNLFKRRLIPLSSKGDSPGQCLMGISLENVNKEEGGCEYIPHQLNLYAHCTRGTQ